MTSGAYKNLRGSDSCDATAEYSRLFDLNDYCDWWLSFRLKREIFLRRHGFLFKGKNWARWILVVLLVMAGSMLIVEAIAGLPGMEKAVVLYAMSFTYLFSAGLLAFSKTVAGYFPTPALRGDSL